MADSNKIGEIYIDIVARTEKLEQGLAAVKEKAAASGTTVENLGKNGSTSLLNMAQSAYKTVTAYAAVAVAIKFVKDSVSQYLEAAKAQAKVEAIVETTGQAAGYSAKQLGRMAEELSKLAGIDDDQIMNDVTANLLTFKNVSGEAFKQAQQSVIDMSAVMGGDLVSRTIMVGKALNDPIQGLTALRRVGVQLSDQQQKQVEAFMKVNKIASAQSIILKELESEFGGAAKASNDADGGLANLGVTFGNLMEKIGGFLVGVLHPLAIGLTKLLGGNKELSTVYDEQNAKVQNLQNKIVPLIYQYDQLNAKLIENQINGKDNATVQKDLISVVGAIGEAIPGAITKWNDYGQAMDINRTAALNFIEVEKARLRLINKEAIEKYTTVRDNAIKERNTVTDDLNKSSDTEVKFFDKTVQTSITRKHLSSQQKSERQAKLPELNQTITGAQAEINRLNGTGVNDEKIKQVSVTPTIGKGKGDSKEKFDQVSELEKLQTELIKNEYDKRRATEIISFNESIRGYEKNVKDKTMAYEDYSKNYDLQDKILADKIVKIAEEEQAALIKAKADAMSNMFKLDEEQLNGIGLNESRILEIKKAYLQQKLALYGKESTEYKSIADEMFIIDQHIISAQINESEKATQDKIDGFELTTDEYIKQLNLQVEAEKKALATENLLRKKYGLPEVTATVTGEGEKAKKIDKYKTGKTDKDTSEWEKQNKAMAGLTSNSIDAISNEWANAMSTWLTEGKSFGAAFAHVWTNIADQVINELARIGVQFAMLTAAQAIFSGATGGFGGFLIKALGGHNGGDYYGTDSGVMKLAAGGSFIVPAGYNNDSFPLMVESGERVTVTPANATNKASSGSEGMLINAMDKINGSIQAMNMNLVRKDMKVNVVSYIPDVRTDIAKKERIKNRLFANGNRYEL